MKKLIIYYILLFVEVCVAQDTIFIKSHDVKNVRNIDVVNSKLLIRYSDSYQFFYNGNYSENEKLPINTKSYTWSDNLSDNARIYHSDFIPRDKVLKNKNRLKNLLPGEITDNISLCQIKNKLFICWKGKLLEYKINTHYKRLLNGCSVRNIYRDNKFFNNIVSTYSGIYLFDINLNFIKKFDKPTYANGELCIINNNQYLCSDDLYLKKQDSFALYWQRDGIDKFRKLLSFNGNTYGIFENSFSLLNLAKKQEKLIAHIKMLSDVESFNKSLLLSSENGGLYLYYNNKIKTIFNNGVGIYDIVVKNKTIYLCCDDGIRILDSHFQVVKHINIYKSIKLIPLEDAIITSTYKGLYYIDLLKNNIYELIPEVEFNKKALFRSDNYIYAGSIQGLYIVNIVELNTDFLETLESTDITEEKNTIFYLAMITILSLLIVVIVTYYKRKNKPKISINHDSVFDNLDQIYDIIKKNSNIKSVEDLSTFIGVSPPTLITKIKKKTGMSPLMFLKDCKRRIAIDLLEEGYTLEEISRRVGYSVRYIKSTLLK